MLFNLMTKLTNQSSIDMVAFYSLHFLSLLRMPYLCTALWLMITPNARQVVPVNAPIRNIRTHGNGGAQAWVYQSIDRLVIPDISSFSSIRPVSFRQQVSAIQQGYSPIRLAPSARAIRGDHEILGL